MGKNYLQHVHHCEEGSEIWGSNEVLRSQFIVP